MTNNFGYLTKTPRMYSQASGTNTAYTVEGLLPQDLVGLFPKIFTELFDPGFGFENNNQPNRFGGSRWRPISGGRDVRTDIRTDGHTDGRTYGLRDIQFGGDNLQVPIFEGKLK
jgi:hypothetical protein